jgi:hypothetical protein
MIRYSDEVQRQRALALADDLRYRELDLQLARLRITRKEAKLEQVRAAWLHLIKIHLPPTTD